MVVLSLDSGAMLQRFFLCMGGMLMSLTMQCKGYNLEKITPSNPEIYDNFGSTVSVYDDFVAVGTEYEREVWMFKYNESTQTFNQTQVLSQSTSDFGFSVHMYNGSMIVGSGYGEYAYIYERDYIDQDTWIEISAVEFPSYAQIVSVAIGNNWAVAGCTQCDDFTGEAYVVERVVVDYIDSNGTVAQNVSWQVGQTLRASDATGYNYFGRSVSITDDKYILVGSDFSYDTYHHGNAYIFELINGSWIEQQRLFPNDTFYEYFGYTVSISGTHAAIGAQAGDTAYMFERDDKSGNWTQTAKLNGTTSTGFGQSVSLWENYCVVGAYLTNSQEGEAYIYHKEHSSGQWQLIETINPNIFNDTDLHLSSNDRFGQTVAIDKNFAVVGAERQDIDGITDVGSVYIVSLFKNNADISDAPTVIPSTYPTSLPSTIPSTNPTQPTSGPTFLPSTEPTHFPSFEPTGFPTDDPTMIPSRLPTILPTISPTNVPTEDTSLNNKNNDNSNAMDTTTTVLVVLVCLLVITNLITLLYCDMKRKNERNKNSNVENGKEKSSSKKNLNRSLGGSKTSSKSGKKHGDADHMVASIIEMLNNEDNNNGNEIAIDADDSHDDLYAANVTKGATGGLVTEGNGMDTDEDDDEVLAVPPTTNTGGSVGEHEMEVVEPNPTASYAPHTTNVNAINNIATKENSNVNPKVINNNRDGNGEDGLSLALGDENNHDHDRDNRAHVGSGDHKLTVEGE